MTWFATAHGRLQQLAQRHRLKSDIKPCYPRTDSLAEAMQDWLQDQSVCGSDFFQDPDNRICLLNLFHEHFGDLWAAHASTAGLASALSADLLAELAFCAEEVCRAYTRFYGSQQALNNLHIANRASTRRGAKRPCGPRGLAPAGPSRGGGRQ